jgi:hypothetical protein
MPNEYKKVIINKNLNKAKVSAVKRLILTNYVVVIKPLSLLPKEKR